MLFGTPYCSAPLENKLVSSASMIEKKGPMGPGILVYKKSAQCVKLNTFPDSLIYFLFNYSVNIKSMNQDCFTFCCRWRGKQGKMFMGSQGASQGHRTPILVERLWGFKSLSGYRNNIGLLFTPMIKFAFFLFCIHHCKL